MDNLNFKQLPDPIITKIGAQLNSATQARLGQAMGHDGVRMRLGAREKKAAIILQSTIRTSDKRAPFKHWKRHNDLSRADGRGATLIQKPLWNKSAGARRSNAEAATYGYPTI